MRRASGSAIVMPFSAAASRYQRDRQLRQNPARFIRSMFWTSVRSRRCATRRRKVAASSSMRVLSSMPLSVGDVLYCGAAGSFLPEAIERGIGENRRQRAGKALGPCSGAGVVADLVLADLDRHVRQAACERVMAHGVAGRVPGRIGLVVA